MRIVVVSHYFPPEIGAPQARLSDLARFWAAAGDEVTVLTGMPNHPTGRVAARVQAPHPGGGARRRLPGGAHLALRHAQRAHPAQAAVSLLVHGLQHRPRPAQGRARPTW